MRNEIVWVVDNMHLIRIDQVTPDRTSKEANVKKALQILKFQDVNDEKIDLPS